MNHLPNQTEVAAKGAEMLRAIVRDLPPAEGPALGGYILLRLSKDIDGLGLKGALVIANRDDVRGPGDWVAIQTPDGYSILPWRADLPHEAKIIKVLN